LKPAGWPICPRELLRLILIEILSAKPL